MLWVVDTTVDAYTTFDAWQDCADHVGVCCRCAAEATNTVAVGRAAVEHSALERELAALRKEVRA